MIEDLTSSDLAYETRDALARLGRQLLREHAALYDQWAHHRESLAQLQRRGYELREVHDDTWLAIDHDLATHLQFELGLERAANAAPPFVTIVGHVAFTTEWAAASD